MARKDKATKQDNVIKFDVHLEDDVNIQVVVERDTEPWTENIRNQLLMWRNIPLPSQINIYDVSVKKLCARYNVNALRDTGVKAKNVRESVVRFVQGEAIKQTNSLEVTVKTFQYLRNAFVLDTVENQFKLRPDIEAFFSEDEIKGAIDAHFDRERVENAPEFPTFSRSIAAEYLIPLTGLLLDTFDIQLQLESKMEAMGIDAPTAEGGGDDTVDDGGFPTE